MGTQQRMPAEQTGPRRGNTRLAWVIGAVVLAWYLLAVFWVLQK